MSATQYRCAIAWQNVGYNQPPHPSFYVGDDKTDYPKPNVKTAVDSVTIETTTPEQSTETIMSTENFDNADMSEWGGTVVKENAPYNNVLSLSGNTTKELANTNICVKITAEYNDDKTIKNVTSEQVDISEAKPMEVNGNTKVMYWNSLRGMKPVTADSIIDVPSTVQLKFMWKPTANNSSVSLADENGDNIFTISKPDGAVTYTVNGETKTIDTSLSKNDWYSVSITVDTVSKLIDCTVKDYSSVGINEKGIYGVSYTGGEVKALKSTGSNYLDNVSFAGIKYNVPMKSVSINVTDGNNPISGAEIALNGKTVKSNSNGTATIMLREDNSYNVTVRKAGYKTYSGTISENETSKNITLEVAQENDVYVKYLNTDGEEIADKKLVGKALYNATYTVSEDNLEDIKTADGTIYEFDTDETVELTVTVDGETNIELIYKVKNTPVENDLNELRVNFGKNSIGSSAWSSQVTSEYKTTIKGVNYGMFGNIGSNDITVNLPAALGDSFIIEYDMYVSNIDEGNIFSMVPYSGNTEENPVGFVNDGSSIALVTGDNASKPTYIAYTNRDYRGEAYAKEQILYTVITGSNGDLKVSLINRDTGVLYVNNQSYSLSSNVGSTNKIDKLVFKRVTGSGDCSIGLGELKAYTVGAPTSASWLYVDELNMTAQSEKSIAPITCVHGADYTSASIDLTDGISYKVTSDEQGEQLLDSGITVDTDGTLAVSDSIANGTYYAQIMYNGNIFKTVPVHVVPGVRENFWTEDFEGETHKFQLTDSGMTANEYWKTDGATVNKADGKIYGVGARSGGNTSASSEEINISEHKGLAIDLNFRMDACADTSSSYVSLLGEKNSAHSVGSSTEGQILTISAKANGNGTWNVITVNGVNIKAKANIHNGTNNGEGDGLSLKRDTTGWLHLYVVPNFEKQKSAVLITRISDGSIVYSGELDFVTQADSFKYVYVSGGKQYNATWLDNIEISGINSNISSLVESISVTPPTKTEYTVGEAFNKDGMVVTANYKDGTIAKVDDYTVSGFDSTKEGTCTVTVRYKGKTAAFDVTVTKPELPDGVFYQNNFENMANSILTSSNTGRYTTALKTENGNTYDTVTAVSCGNNGAFITTDAFQVDENTDYTMTFDMALTPTGSNNAQKSYLFIRSAKDDCTAYIEPTQGAEGDYILRLTQVNNSTTQSENTQYIINDTDSETVTLDAGTWYSYTIDVVYNTPYLTIKDADGTAVFERKAITKKTENGGLNGMYYATKRYSAGLAIDNIVVKEYVSE